MPVGPITAIRGLTPVEEKAITVAYNLIDKALTNELAQHPPKTAQPFEIGIYFSELRALTKYRGLLTERCISPIIHTYANIEGDSWTNVYWDPATGQIVFYYAPSDWVKTPDDNCHDSVRTVLSLDDIFPDTEPNEGLGAELAVIG